MSFHPPVPRPKPTTAQTPPPRPGSRPGRKPGPALTAKRVPAHPGKHCK
jgi:hypothetical protein